jgi:putative PIN family toxin of toxin-antitoxin system
MPRVVFDTNIFISAFITSGGNGERAVKAVLDDKAGLFTSIQLLTELARILENKFGWEKAAVERAVVLAASLGKVVKPSRKIGVLHDDPDNRVLECASEAGADLIVTGDGHLLSLGKFEEIKIVTLSEFLKTI